MPSTKLAVRPPTHNSTKAKSIRPRCKPNQKTAKVLGATPEAAKTRSRSITLAPRENVASTLALMAEDFDMLPAAADVRRLYRIAEGYQRALVSVEIIEDDPRDERLEAMRRCVKTLETGEPLTLPASEDRRCASRFAALLFQDFRRNIQYGWDSMASEFEEFDAAERPWEQREEARRQEQRSEERLRQEELQASYEAILASYEAAGAGGQQ